MRKWGVARAAPQGPDPSPVSPTEDKAFPPCRGCSPPSPTSAFSPAAAAKSLHQVQAGHSSHSHPQLRKLRHRRSHARSGLAGAGQGQHLKPEPQSQSQSGPLVAFPNRTQAGTFSLVCPRLWCCCSRTFHPVRPAGPLLQVNPPKAPAQNSDTEAQPPGHRTAPGVDTHTAIPFRNSSTAWQ